MLRKGKLHSYTFLLAEASGTQIVEAGLVSQQRSFSSNRVFERTFAKREKLIFSRALLAFPPSPNAQSCHPVLALEWHKSGTACLLYQAGPDAYRGVSH